MTQDQEQQTSLKLNLKLRAPVTGSASQILSDCGSFGLARPASGSEAQIVTARLKTQKLPASVAGYQ